MSKELKPLDVFREIVKSYTKLFNRAINHPIDTIVKWEGVEEIEKSLKALEIIKNKKVNVCMLFWYFKYKPTYKKYTEAFKELTDEYLGEEMLTEEEYNLLKEVLL